MTNRLPFSSSGFKRLPILSLSLALTQLPACTVGPDFTRPTPPTQSQYSQDKRSPELAKALQSGKELPGHWWHLYRSNALSKLIALAIKNNPDLQSAQAALAQAQETATAKKSSLLPSFDAEAYSTRQLISSSQFGDPGGSSSMFSLYNASVKVSYTLDIFGSIRRQIENLEAEAEYQKFELEATFLTLASNIVTTAIKEASLREQIAAYQEIIASQAQQLAVTEQQFDLGGTSQAEVLAQQSSLEQFRANLPPLQLELEQTRHQLATLIGQSADKPLTEQFKLSDLQLPQQLPLSLPSKLVQQRPDIRAQEALIHAATAQIGVAVASVFPDLTISGNAGTIATDIGQLFIPGSEIWSITADVLQPVFHGGDFTHKRSAAVAYYDQAVAQYRKTVLTAFNNVADTLSALEWDATAFKTQRTAEQAAAASLELTRAQHQLGGASHLTLLNAHREYQQAKIGRIKAEAARLADTAALFQALGGGWWQRSNLAETLQANREAQQIPCSFFECWINPLPKPKPETTLPVKQ